MLFKLSNLNSNFALTLGYPNPALNNSALVNNQILILSTDSTQPTSTLKMTATQFVERSVNVNNNSPIQDYDHLDDHAQPTY